MHFLADTDKSLIIIMLWLINVISRFGELKWLGDCLLTMYCLCIRNMNASLSNTNSSNGGSLKKKRNIKNWQRNWLDKTVSKTSLISEGLRTITMKKAQEPSSAPEEINSRDPAPF